MSTVKIEDIINAISVAETVYLINLDIQETNSTAHKKATNIEKAENFIYNGTFPYAEILSHIDTCTSEYAKKELLFFAYYLTKGLTWSSLAREKQRIVELVSI